jgi:hypothetical protein
VRACVRCEYMDVLRVSVCERALDRTPHNARLLVLSSISLLCARSSSLGGVLELQYVVPRRSGIYHACLYMHVRCKCFVSNSSTCIHSGHISGMSAAGRVSTVYSNAQHPKVFNMVRRR